MVSVTLSIPEDVKRKMERFPEMNWSGFIRKSIEEKTKEMFWREDMLKKLKEERASIDWSIGLQKKARAGRFEQLKKKGLV